MISERFETVMGSLPFHLKCKTRNLIKSCR